MVALLADWVGQSLPLIVSRHRSGGDDLDESMEDLAEQELAWPKPKVTKAMQKMHGRAQAILELHDRRMVEERRGGYLEDQPANCARAGVISRRL